MFLVGSAAVPAVHELVHGLAVRGPGARPIYGFYGRRLVFHAKAPRHSFGRGGYLAIVLGALAGQSAVALIAFVLLPGTSIAWVIAI